MAIICEKPSVSLSITLQLNEEEARALVALTDYGKEPFLDVFYKHLGSTYLKPHEAGLGTLFACVRSSIPPYLDRIREVRGVFTGIRTSLPAEK